MTFRCLTCGSEILNPDSYVCAECGANGKSERIRRREMIWLCLGATAVAFSPLLLLTYPEGTTWFVGWALVGFISVLFINWPSGSSHNVNLEQLLAYSLRQRASVPIDHNT